VLLIGVESGCPNSSIDEAMFYLSGGYAVFSSIKISKLINESNKVKITCFISSKTYLSTYGLSTVLGFGNTKVDTVYILKKL